MSNQLAPLEANAPADRRKHFDPSAAPAPASAASWKTMFRSWCASPIPCGQISFSVANEFKTDSAEQFAAHAREYQKHLWDDVLGRLDGSAAAAQCPLAAGLPAAALDRLRRGARRFSRRVRLGRVAAAART